MSAKASNAGFSPRSRRHAYACTLLTVWLAWGLGVPGVRAQEGYRIVGDEIRVDRPDQWAAWRGAAGVIDVVGGGIRPRRLRGDVNVAPSALADSVGGAVTAGSNEATAFRVVDGDSSGWSPELDSSLTAWWVDVDLGRAAVVRRIRIRFADEGQGDPFLQFRVLGWVGWEWGPTLRNTDIPLYWEIGRTDRPNKVQRVFDFEPQTVLGASDGFDGEVLSRITVEALKSDGLRGELLRGESEYLDLPAGRRGAIEYLRQTNSGRYVPITREEFESGGAANRDSIRYYRREFPRIAEIEVFTAGDDITQGLQARSGSIRAEYGGIDDVRDVTRTVTDGNVLTGDYLHVSGAHRLVADLGAFFWIDRLHFLTWFMRLLDLEVSDGSQAPDGSLIWARPPLREGYALTSARASFHELRTEPVQARYVRATFNWSGITEMILYGGGFVGGLALTSDIIAFDEPLNLLRAEWQAQLPPGTRVELETRTGNELVTDTLYYDSNNIRKTRREYYRLPRVKRSELVLVPQPASDWSPWSARTAQPGAAITSPSPRRYLQVRVTLASERPDTAATLRSLTIHTAEPVADGLTGEISPQQTEGGGAADVFTLYIGTDLARGQGLDRLRIVPSSGVEVTEVLDVRYGSRTAFMRDETTDLTGGQLRIETTADTVELELPRRLSFGVQLLAVRFRAAVHAGSGAFEVFAWDAAGGKPWQQVVPGDATDMASSSSTTVIAVGLSGVSGLQLRSRTLSPNGDGVNDAVDFDFVVSDFAIAGGGSRAPVTIRIHDLSGRLLREIVAVQGDRRGTYTMRWDGRGARGRLVPPGLYVATLRVDAPSGALAGASMQRVVHVAY